MKETVATPTPVKVNWSEQKAKLLALKEEKFIRLSWVDKPDGYYFEFKIEKDELTGDISLIIVDFADEASDEQTSKRLWDSQVNKLLHVIGSYHLSQYRYR